MIFRIKILNKINFFLIIIFILLQFKTVYLFSLKFLWTTDIQNALLLVNWPPQCIAIDHSSIGLQRITIQLLVNEVWLCVLTSLLHHNTSQVCTATLIIIWLSVRIFSHALIIPEMVQVEKQLQLKISQVSHANTRAPGFYLYWRQFLFCWICFASDSECKIWSFSEKLDFVIFSSITNTVCDESPDCFMNFQHCLGDINRCLQKK